MWLPEGFTAVFTATGPIAVPGEPAIVELTKPSPACDRSTRSIALRRRSMTMSGPR